ncbi:MAG TPA: hypothetical protein VFJ19_02005 [Nocardioidaceae bacterium]|nr:hypothetical protein [Nocardioidaceae bacterium]
MRFAAISTWVAAALVGSYLLATWVANDGLRRKSDTSSRFAPQLIFSHGGLAATGLLVWIGYLVVGVTAIAWAALGLLGVVATLGATMFGLWLRGGHGQPRGKHASGPRHAAEDNFPPPAVWTHGLFAVATVGLVLATALRTIP